MWAHQRSAASLVVNGWGAQNLAGHTVVQYSLGSYGYHVESPHGVAPCSSYHVRQAYHVCIYIYIIIYDYICIYILDLLFQ